MRGPVALITAALLWVGPTSNAGADLSRVHHPARLPAKSAIVAKTKAAVKASNARLIGLEVDIPTTYGLSVRVSDPAAYLHHRVNILLDRVLDAIRPVHFRAFSFSVSDRAGIAFTYDEYHYGDGHSSSTWYVRPELIPCANGIDLDVEIGVDYDGPPCPA